MVEVHMSEETWQSGFEVAADNRSRLSLAKAGVTKNQRFRVSKDERGVLTLTPMVSIPDEELIFWKNMQVQESVKRGLIDVEKGKVHTVDRFFG